MTEPTAAPSPFQLFALRGFPCSGLDWVARLLALHPRILMVDALHPLGPHGSGKNTTKAQCAAVTATAVQAACERAAQRPGVTHICFVSLDGDALEVDGPHIEVMRDGRDVVVHWTLAQLRHRGEALQGFLAPARDRRMPEIEQRFRADPDDVLTKNRGLLLWDSEWVRFAAHMWDSSVTSFYSACGLHDDGRISGPEPIGVTFEQARDAPRDTFDYLVKKLGLDPTAVPPFAHGVDPVVAATTDADRLAEWEIGIWRRFFTKRASRWFQMDGWAGLECVAKVGAHIEWEGECPPFPV